MIIKYGCDHRWNLYEKYYYSDEIIQSDSCVIFKDLDKVEQVICDSFKVCED
ncbi:MAG TPA: hypothetical protein VNZ49_04675 [Bacteroidia bacterium]|nr:hypothetical protein [Bacteroidia bacterium]